MIVYFYCEGVKVWYKKLAVNLISQLKIGLIPEINNVRLIVCHFPDKDFQ